MKASMENAAGPAWNEAARWEKVGDAAAVAPSSFLTTAILGTNTFVLI
jgi:hypothetical protein